MPLPAHTPGALFPIGFFILCASVAISGSGGPWLSGEWGLGRQRFGEGGGAVHLLKDPPPVPPLTCLCVALPPPLPGLL